MFVMLFFLFFFFFFFQAEDGIRDVERSRGLGDVYKRQLEVLDCSPVNRERELCVDTCLLYTSDAADDTPCVDLGGRRIIKKKKKMIQSSDSSNQEETTSISSHTERNFFMTEYIIMRISEPTS
eukprot:TRINITY_DN8702_c0_g1_i6.p1 TRINITY_DN8702_c0_g1~~TRINITY_DN8702_c0_g1_i6.p1  ORF type:complete len:124 (+),score=42.07 TRINITY_DN8702_c0_g1_i6:105-476(+)